MKYLWFQKNLPKAFEWSLNFFLFFLPWPTVWIVKRWEFDTVFIFAFEILLLIGIFLFLIWYVTNKKYQEFSSRRIIVLGIFLGYCFLSTFWASQPLVAFFQAVRVTEAFSLVILLVYGPFNRAKALVVFIVGATIQSVLGIYQFVTQSTFAFKWLGLVLHPLLETGTSVVQSTEAGRYLRAYGAFAHPNVFGGYLALSIIFTTLFILHRKKKVFFFWFSLLLQLSALFFTWSRSAWIATVVWFVGLVYWWAFKKEKLLQSKKILGMFLLLFIFLGGLTLFYLPLVKTRVQAESFHEVRSITERLSAPQLALDLWQTAPFFGVGAGNYVPAMFDHDPNKQRWVYEPVHLVPLLMLTELGIIGIFLLVLVVFVSFKKFFPCDYLVGLVGISFLPLFLLDHYLYSLPVGIFFCAFWVGFLFQFLHIFSPVSSKR